MANEFKVKKGLTVNGSGSTILDIQGSQGQLFSITDQLSGSLFSVNDISGIPIMEVFSDDTINLGTFGAEAIIVSGSTTTIGNLNASGIFTGSFQGDSFIKSGSTSDDILLGDGTTASLNSKQSTLISGTNIKKINDESLLGSGSLNIGGNTKSFLTTSGLLNFATTGQWCTFNANSSFNEPVYSGNRGGSGTLPNPFYKDRGIFIPPGYKVLNYSCWIIDIGTKTLETAFYMRKPTVIGDYINNGTSFNLFLLENDTHSISGPNTSKFSGTFDNTASIAETTEDSDILFYIRCTNGTATNVRYSLLIELEKI